MDRILNITNGDSASELMKIANIPGEHLPWRDVLHEGPVPARLPLEALSKIRANFIAQRGWGDPHQVEQSFIERDETLKCFKSYDRVVLWFEHDLYDQLQLIQILDWFNRMATSELDLSLICTDNYLGTLTPSQLIALQEHETPVSKALLNLASRAWQAFREETPQHWLALLNEETDALEFLHGAIVRMVEELPDDKTGLSRTELQALTLINQGKTNLWELFAANQAMEERVYLGDASFWFILQTFLDASPALLELNNAGVLGARPDKDQEVTLTRVGKAVLEGDQRWFEIHPIDRWIGGTHLTQENLWVRNAANTSEIWQA